MSRFSVTLFVTLMLFFTLFVGEGTAFMGGGCSERKRALGKCRDALKRSSDDESWTAPKVRRHNILTFLY